MSFTKRQARALLEWGKGNPKAVEAYTNPSDPGHAEAQKYAMRLFEIISGPGAEDPSEPIFDAETFMARYYAGEAAVKTRLEGIVAGAAAPPALAKPLPEDDGLAELRGLSPEAARAQLDRLMKNPEFAELLHKEKAPLIVAGWDLLHQIAHPGNVDDGPTTTAPVAAASPSPSPSPAPRGSAAAVAANAEAEALARLNQLNAAIAADPKHPAWDAAHPNHKAAAAERTALYHAAYPEPAAGAEPASGGAVVTE